MKPKSWFVQFALGGECFINGWVSGDEDPGAAADHCRAEILARAPQFADMLPPLPALVQAVLG